MCFFSFKLSTKYLHDKHLLQYMYAKFLKYVLGNQLIGTKGQL